MLHLDPSVVGKHVKLGNVWVKLDDIIVVDVEPHANGRKKLVVKCRGGKPNIEYTGPLPDHVKDVLRSEGKPGKD